MESNWNVEDECYYLMAEDWDEEAFIILMNILHHRNRKVPRTVTLETLAKIAVVVDYYECNESLDLFITIWTTDLQSKAYVPKTYCRDLILWMWVSWIFDMPERFKKATLGAVMQCTEQCRNLGLPIPYWITGKC